MDSIRKLFSEYFPNIYTSLAGLKIDIEEGINIVSATQVLHVQVSFIDVSIGVVWNVLFHLSDTWFGNFWNCLISFKDINIILWLSLKIIVFTNCTQACSNKSNHLLKVVMIFSGVLWKAPYHAAKLGTSQGSIW